MQNKKLQTVGCVLLGFAVLFILTILEIYQCPLRFLVGVPCPLCGMSRALYALLHGDIPGSFYYHPLWPVAVIAVFLYIGYEMQILHFTKKKIMMGVYIVGALVLICYVYRHIIGSPIVAVHFHESFIGGTICRIPFF